MTSLMRQQGMIPKPVVDQAVTAFAGATTERTRPVTLAFSSASSNLVKLSVIFLSLVLATAQAPSRDLPRENWRRIRFRIGDLCNAFMASFMISTAPCRG